MTKDVSTTDAIAVAPVDERLQGGFASLSPERVLDIRGQIQKAD